jgi:hypothetical protein
MMEASEKVARLEKFMGLLDAWEDRRDPETKEKD